MTLNPLIRALEPTHPGALLREIVLPAVDLGKAEIARRLGVSRQTLYALLAEEASVTAPLALRLGKLFGNGPDLWLNMQGRFDLQKAEAEMTADLAGIETIQAA